MTVQDDGTRLSNWIRAIDATNRLVGHAVDIGDASVGWRGVLERERSRIIWFREREAWSVNGER